MKRLLGTVISGQSLRHRPVALRAAEQRPVRAVVKTERGERDVTPLLFPVSLNPLLLGLCRTAGEPPAGAPEVRMHDEVTGHLLGSMHLESAGIVDHAGRCVDLLRPVRSSVRCVPFMYRAWRHALAWRQAQLNARQPHAFQMTFPDLRALNVFYMMPRPVYLVSVAHLDASNIFPMDLVGPLGDGTFLLALRLTSPAVELMRRGGRIVVSGVPAELKETAYRLAAHHKQRSIGWDALPFPVTASPVFSIPVPAEALRVRELQVLRSEAVGSHMFFITSIVSDSTRSNGLQLCHVSDMYARWRAVRGRPFTDA
jgi:flavin reductase (DIM6/NTAB) family NADH-FMN oxidoreductase RutF